MLGNILGKAKKKKDHDKISQAISAQLRYDMMPCRDPRLFGVKRFGIAIVLLNNTEAQSKSTMGQRGRDQYHKP